ncbi:Transcriptional regulatory protein CreB [Burkholderiales bacterium]|nr:Transcriptional regulatory protein CreB [Burkholderiales bacterium]
MSAPAGPPQGRASQPPERAQPANRTHPLPQEGGRGEGTTRPAGPPQGRASQAPERAQHEATPVSARVLLIEDDRPIAENVILALERVGLACQHASLAAEGLARIKAGGVDLLILDVGLPDGNGFDLCRALRKFTDLPVIFLTAHADEIDRVVGLEIGADDYVVKPFSPRELAARVKTILRRVGAASGTDRPTPPAIAVDAERAAIACYGQPLALSRAEYLLLKAMAAHPGKVFSRAQLLDLAGLSEDSTERAIDTHVKSLRAKLALAAPAADLLRTHRGLGYSLASE